MKEIQFVALVLLPLLTMKLLLLPRWAVRIPSISRSRWLLAAGTGLLAVQFLLQYKLGLRAIGVTQAVMLNLVLFIPCSWLFGLSIICLQRQGRTNFWDRYVGPFAWVIVLTILSVAASIDGQPLLSDTRELRWAEIISSDCYLLMQAYYTWRHLSNIRAMRQALSNYFDRDMGNLLRWMQISLLILVVMSLMVPLLIYAPDYVLGVFALIFFIGIFYLVDSFCLFVVSSAPQKLMEAEESEQEEQTAENTVPAESLQRVEQAVAQWVANGGHLKNGLKLPNAAEEMQIPRYLLSVWLKQSGRHYSEWLTELRIDEAKRTMLAHPEWSNEAVAQHCGFNDRCYFQKKFKEITGMTPAQFVS